VTRHAAPTRSLRANPDLRQLRRQAKELLAAFRAGDEDTVAEVHLHYHDADAASFALHDAQLVLARAYGFDSWPKLKASVNQATVSRLIEAVRAGDLAKTQALVEAHPELVNAETSPADEHRALHHAVLARHVEMVRLLMAHGADARIGIYPHRVPTTALAIARERGYTELVAIIREAEDGRPEGRPPARYAEPAPWPHELDDAIKRGDSRAAIDVLESTASRDALMTTADHNGVTLLYLAAGRTLVELVGYLLEHGADANARAVWGATPIVIAHIRARATNRYEGLKETEALLIQHGAERTALWAVAANNADWLRAQHRAGTLETRVTAQGGLLTAAVWLNRPEMLTVLLDLGFDPDERPDPAQRGGKPLETCVTEQRFDMAETLIARGATLTAPLAVALGKADWLRARHSEGGLQQPAEGDGLLTVAVERGRRDMLELLLALGFNADEPRNRINEAGVDESRGVPLSRAAGKGDVATVELLLAHGADPNAPQEGPIWMAYRNRDHSMVDLLVRHGGIINAASAGYHRDVAAARQLIQAEDAGRLPPGAVPPGRTVAEELLDGECGEPEIIRLALARIDWPPEDSRWYNALRGPRSFWSHVPWIQSPQWNRDKGGYLTSFQLILARTHANQKGSLGRTILHDVMAMGYHDGASGWISDEEALAFAVALLDAGARTDVRDDLLQSTPLGWACRWGRTPIVKELLRRGVDSVERDAQPWAAPRAWAEKMGHREIVALLDQHRIRVP
jgi:ankyrin repeat protein